MAAATLRRYSGGIFAANTLTTVVPAIPAGRALVIGKIIVANVSGAQLTFGIAVGGVFVASAISLAPSEVYTESGLVMVAGDNAQVTVTIANGVVASFYGEEVDN